MKFFIFFLFFMLFSLQTWGDENIWFILPSKGQPVSGELIIKIMPPQAAVPVLVWLENKRTEQIVWHQMLSVSNNYTINIDTTQFSSGKYELNAEYYFDDDTYDGDMDIFINNPSKK